MSLIARRWWLTIDSFTHTIKASDEPSPPSPARGYEVVEVVPASQLTGAVGALREMTADRDRWRHEYRIEKQKNALLRADLRQARAALGGAVPP